MANTGAILPRSATTAAEDPWLDNDWVNPANIYGAGEASVTAATYDAADQTYVLKGYNFDLSAIPDGSSIQGVICVVTARYATVTVSIDLLQLLDTSLGKVGTNLCATPQALTTTSSPYTFGTSTNTWGNALTAAWVKNSNFGVAIGCLAGGSGNSNNDVYIDSVTLDVYYTAPTPVSDNQPAYMSVRAIITDNQPSYTKGKTTTLDNQPSYLEGTLASVADIQTNEGHLRFSGIGNSYARALAKSVATSDEEVLLKFKFNETSSGGTFRVFIRASNNWADWQTPTTAYEVAISNTGNWIVNRITTGSRTQIGSTVTWTSSTNYYWLRFYANSTNIKAKVWQDGSSEPTWDLTVNDTGGFTTAGNLQLGYFRTAGSKEMYVDGVDLHASTAGVVTSDNQPSYLKGRATLTDNQISYTKGKDTSLDNQPSYLHGSVNVVDNQTSYLKGTATLVDNQFAYLQGKSTSTDNQLAYLSGIATITDNQIAYLQGKSTLSDNQIVYTQGKDSLLDNQPSYIKVATFPFTENFPEANGQPWNPSNWETYTTLAGYIDVNGNTGRMGGETGVEKAVALVPRTTESQEVLFQFPQTSDLYRTTYVAIVARDYATHTDQAYPENGYAIELVRTSTLTVRVVKIKNGTKTTIQTIPGFFGDITFRFKYEPIDGTTARLKFKGWSTSSPEYAGWRASDPISWVFTVERFTNGGGLVLGSTWNNTGSGYSNFDNIDYHVPSLESNWIFAYTKGRATVTDNQIAYLKGRSTLTDNQPSYLLGVAGISDNQPAYLSGKDTSLDNQIAYLAGKDTLSDNQPAYILATGGITDNQPVYLAGKDTLLDNQISYLAGGIEVTDNQIAYLKGRASISNNIPAFIEVFGDVLDHQPAYLKGKDSTVDNQIAYLVGGIVITDNQSSYLAGKNTSIDNQPAYLTAIGITLDNQIAYLCGRDIISDNQIAYLKGGIVVSDSQSAYLNGSGNVLSDNQPAYLKGLSTIVDNQIAYTKGKSTVSDNQPSYLNGTAGTLTDHQPAYLNGTVIQISDNQFAYLLGKDTLTDNQSAYLKGKNSLVDNQIAFLKGTATLTDNQPSYLKGKDSSSNNVHVFLVGGIISIDNTTAYLSGIATLVDNQNAYIRGSYSLVNNIPAYLSANFLLRDNLPSYLYGVAGRAPGINLTGNAIVDKIILGEASERSILDGEANGTSLLEGDTT